MVFEPADEAFLPKTRACWLRSDTDSDKSATAVKSWINRRNFDIDIVCQHIDLSQQFIGLMQGNVHIWAQRFDGFLCLINHTTCFLNRDCQID